MLKSQRILVLIGLIVPAILLPIVLCDLGSRGSY